MPTTQQKLGSALVFAGAYLICQIDLASAAAKQIITIAYLSQELKVPPPLSNLDPFIKNKGVNGAELAIKDNNTTGQFTKQEFVLKKFIVPADQRVIDTYNEKIAGKFNFVINMIAQEDQLKIADSVPSTPTIFFDTFTSDDGFRNEHCRNNIFHILPSRSMRADAIAQYMMKKRWTKWFLVTGNQAGDKLFADAIKRAAKRFGISITEEKSWE